MQDKELMSAGKPEISIIVPFYNVEPYARRCIESIQGQTLENIEIILVDDGSPDSCGAIIDEYAAGDPRIKALHIQNGGIAHARNEGLKVASAEVIGFVDSDDWIEPQMYEEMLHLMQSTGADICMCDYVFDFPHYTKSSIEEPVKENLVFSNKKAVEMLIEDRFIRNYVWNKIFKRTVITECFPKNIVFEDLWVMIKWLHNAEKICYTPYVGYHYIQRNGTVQSSAKSIENQRPYIAALEVQLKFLKENGYPRKVYERQLLSMAKICIIIARDFARKLPYSNDLGLGFQKVVEFLRQYENDFLPLLNNKYRHRYNLLKKSPRLFYNLIKLQGWLQPKRLFKKKVVIYE